MQIVYSAAIVMVIDFINVVYLTILSMKPINDNNAKIPMPTPRAMVLKYINPFTIPFLISNPIMNILKYRILVIARDIKLVKARIMLVVLFIKTNVVIPIVKKKMKSADIFIFAIIHPKKVVTYAPDGRRPGRSSPKIPAVGIAPNGRLLTTLREPIGANPRHHARVCGRAQCGGAARASAVGRRPGADMETYQKCSFSNCKSCRLVKL